MQSSHFLLQSNHLGGLVGPLGHHGLFKTFFENLGALWPFGALWDPRATMAFEGPLGSLSHYGLLGPSGILGPLWPLRAL